MTDSMEFGNASLEEAAVIAETMENPETLFVDGTAEPAPEAIPEAEAQTAATASRPQKLTVEYILERLEEISKDNTSFQGIIQIGSIPPDKGCGDMAMALSSSIEAHERTNQKLIEAYQKMYEDLQKKGDPEEESFRRMKEQMHLEDRDEIEWLLDRLTDEALPEEVRAALTCKLNLRLKVPENPQKEGKSPSRSEERVELGREILYQIAEKNTPENVREALLHKLDALLG